MKVCHLSAEIKTDITPVIKKALPLLDKNCKIAIVSSVQHLSELDNVKEFLETNGFSAISYGQVLGCKTPSIKEKQVICIGTGQFHTKGILLKAKNKIKKVIMCDVLSQETKEFTEKDIEKILKRKKGAMLKFLSSKIIGVMISVKTGQTNVQKPLDEIIKLKEKFPDKNFYFFACNTLDINEMENFPFIESWINTLCPRIGNDDAMEWSKPILNIQDLDDLTYLSS